MGYILEVKLIELSGGLFYGDEGENDLRIVGKYKIIIRKMIK